MSIQVHPKEHCLPDTGNYLMSNQRPKPEMHRSKCTLVESLPQEVVNKDLLQAVEKVYKPLLVLMKCFGLYFDDEPISGLTQTPHCSRSKGCKSRFYCGIGVAGLWFNVAMPLVGVFYDSDDLFLLLVFVLWSLLAALNGTICLIVLPLRKKRESRFKNFLLKLVTIRTGSIDFKIVRSKAKNFLIMFLIFFAFSLVSAVILYKIENMSFANYKPWQAWYGFRVVGLLILILGCGFWLLPVIFFCISCLVIETLFGDLYAKMPAMEMTELKARHQRLCEVVELADRMFSHLLIVIVGLSIALICFYFYHIVNFVQIGSYISLFVTSFWILSTMVLLAVIMVFGSRVNEKVSNRIGASTNMIKMLADLYWIKYLSGPR